MSWWRKLLGGITANHPYGLDPDNPVLCGGGVDAEIDYLKRLRCPAGMPVWFQREGSLERTRIDYLDWPDVELYVSRGTRRRIGDADPHELPLDGYLIACGCGDHHEKIFIDMYFRGPERIIAVEGWTLAEGVSPAEKLTESATCPYCGEVLRIPQAKQCRACLMEWHHPNDVHQRNRKAK
jgi:hypothetical protein